MTSSVLTIQHVETTPTDSVRFKLINSYLGLANSLRRTLLSKIPVCTFDDTWNDDETKRSIIVHENTSGIHNEFLAHRLSLVPIRMNTTPPVLKIQTVFNATEAVREFTFQNPSGVPTFTLQKQGDLNNSSEASTISIHENHLTNVTSKDFTFADAEKFSSFSMDQFFPPHSVTGEHILIDVLKTNNNTKGEKVHVTCKPTVGIGQTNARYCSVGTVSFHFEKEDPKVLKRVFEKKIEYMNKERERKELAPITRADKQKMKRSFDLLDSERVYKLQDNGAPMVYCFDVESIGFLPAPQLVMDALCILKQSLVDILRCMTLHTKPVSSSSDKLYGHVSLNAKKIAVGPSLDHLEGISITLLNENHTIGNLIADYLKQLYIITPQRGEHENEILVFAAYKMKHPLEEKIEIKMKLNPTYQLSSLLPQTFAALQRVTKDETPESIVLFTNSPLQNEMLMCQLVLYKTLLHIVHDIRHLETQWMLECDRRDIDITSPSFDVTDAPLFSDAGVDASLFTFLKDSIVSA